ncbi:hypothetical protein PAPYR_6277 [Paratrimastix pyriformis]|uniref:Uncharacterized protein n=1 Tax=Paratrimastix pyriformis TaxID=342808 RepID=A0ABQ8UFF8_9EUKA|nr:hypothetical protein PAPYR_6277 [Paratrimastix pyriformis]
MALIERKSYISFSIVINELEALIPTTDEGADDDYRSQGLTEDLETGDLRLICTLDVLDRPLLTPVVIHVPCWQTPTNQPLKRFKIEQTVSFGIPFSETPSDASLKIILSSSMRPNMECIHQGSLALFQAPLAPGSDYIPVQGRFCIPLTPHASQATPDEEIAGLLRLQEGHACAGPHPAHWIDTWTGTALAARLGKVGTTTLVISAICAYVSHMPWGKVGTTMLVISTRRMRDVSHALGEGRHHHTGDIRHLCVCLACPGEGRHIMLVISTRRMHDVSHALGEAAPPYWDDIHHPMFGVYA